MERVILHVDCDAFYASVECLYRPLLRAFPVAVGGDVEQRHGIILAKNQLAKKYNIKTGDAIWQAKQKCPHLIVVPPDFKKYLRFSQMARSIYHDYTDQVEAFGLDENWLDVTGSIGLLGSGEQIAKEIQKRVFRELGITVSIGVSYNKIFAKLGSDYRKPCGITVLSKENYKEKVWPLPVSDLLMVGRATTAKLERRFIRTIGDLAQASPVDLKRWLGKYGEMLYQFANGLDRTPVSAFDDTQIIKSIGNSITAVRDLETIEDVKMILYVLAESVARRMRQQGFKGRLVSVNLRDTDLKSLTRQHKLDHFTNLSDEITREAVRLVERNCTFSKPLRSIGVSVGDFAHDVVEIQTDLFHNERRREKLERLERSVDGLKNRFGNGTIQRACLLQDRRLTQFNPYDDHNIHPVSFLR